MTTTRKDANAINIIDGFHGLASGTTIIALLALAAIAVRAGDPPRAIACVVLRRRRKQSPGVPDSRHLHCLIKTQFIRKKLPHANKALQHAAAPALFAYRHLAPSGDASRPIRANRASHGRTVL